MKCVRKEMLSRQSKMYRLKSVRKDKGFKENNGNKHSIKGYVSEKTAWYPKNHARTVAKQLSEKTDTLE